MKYYFLPLLFFITSCGEVFSCSTKVVTAPTGQYNTCDMVNLFNSIDNQLRFEIENFSREAIRYQVLCSKTKSAVMSSDMPKQEEGTVIGYCIPYKRMAISEAFWKRATPAEKLTLIYHELGHCALGLDHYDDTHDIMNTYLLPGDIADHKWDQLVSQLFTRVKK